jgi:hypothetical protein
MVLTEAAKSLPLCFLLASGICCPSPVQTYICAIFSNVSNFTLKLEAAWTSETLVLPQHYIQHHIPEDLYLKVEFVIIMSFLHKVQNMNTHLRGHVHLSGCMFHLHWYMS